MSLPHRGLFEKRLSLLERLRRDFTPLGGSFEKFTSLRETLKRLAPPKETVKGLSILKGL